MILKDGHGLKYKRCWVLDFDGALVGPFETIEEAMIYGGNGITRSWALRPVKIMVEDFGA